MGSRLPDIMAGDSWQETNEKTWRYKAKTKKMGERVITQLDIAFEKKAEGLQSGGKGTLPEKVQLENTSRRE